MKLVTKFFDEVDIDEEKIVHFANGIIGFPNLNNFAIIHDEERGVNSPIRWLQSIEEPAFAMPVMDPLMIKEDYNPQVEDEWLKPIGGLDNEKLLILVTVTVPAEISKMTANLKAPVIINAEAKKGCQVIAESDGYEVKYPIYDLLIAHRKAGE